MSDLSRLIALLPQKPPFLFVHEIHELVPMERVTGAVVFPEGHPVFDGHLPGDPIVPGVIIIEALAQLSGLAHVHPETPRPVRGFLGEVRRARFRRKVRPGERVTLSSRLVQQFGGAARFEVEASVGDERVCEAELLLGGG